MTSTGRNEQVQTGFSGKRWTRPVVPNLWYAYPWGYAKIILVMAENTKKKGVKIKTQKQSYEVLVHKKRDLCESCH
jgi:hypothetical protein